VPAFLGRSEPVLVRCLHRPDAGSLRLTIGVGAALLLAVVGGIVAVGLQTDPREARALRTPGAIVGVTYGSRPLVLGANWQKWVLGAWPELQPRIGGWVERFATTPSGTLVVWQYYGTQSPAVDPAPLRVRIRSDQGEVMEEVAEGALDSIGDRAVGRFEISHFPRRGRRLWVTVDPLVTAAAPGEERMVVNPAPGPYPVWQPAPGSARIAGESVEVTLRRFRTGIWEPAFQSRATELDLEFREAGRPAAREWQVLDLTLADATGNRWETFGGGVSQLDPAHLRLSNTGVDLPAESAHRVRVTLARSGGFRSSDLWRLRGLRLSVDGRPMTLNRSTTLHGFRVRLLHLGWRKAETSGSSPARKPVAVVRVEGLAERYCLWQLSHEREHPKRLYGSGGNDLYSLDLDLPRRGVTDMALALTPKVAVEFLAHAERR
jgi:hypothetical protein